uniref:Secreted protein n=1 Tax=Caenorhabditis japonica TaxID=281687 RepID=A0A8R1I5R9_CAEJA
MFKSLIFFAILFITVLSFADLPRAQKGEKRVVRPQKDALLSAKKAGVARNFADPVIVNKVVPHAVENNVSKAVTSTESYSEEFWIQFFESMKVYFNAISNSFGEIAADLGERASEFVKNRQESL